MLDKIGGRKFVVTLLVVAVGTTIELLTERGISQNFVALLLGIGAVYGAGNAIITSKALGASAPSDALTPVDLSSVEAAQFETQQRIEAIAETMAQVGQTAANNQKLLVALVQAK